MRAPNRPPRPRGAALGISLAAFLGLALITVWVWRDQMDRQVQLLSRHAEDVAFQASRRLQVFVESHLKMATVFARRWSSHEARDFSRTRFEEFATVVLDEWPGFFALTLVSPQHDLWTMPPGVNHVDDVARLREQRFFSPPGNDVTARLSAPFTSPCDQVTFFAALPLRRDEADLGWLLLQFRAESLVDESFHERMRSEFNFLVEDRAGPVHRFVPDGEAWVDGQRALARRTTFSLRDREWALTVVPRRRVLATLGWTANAAVPALGFPLAVVLSYLVWLLLCRVDLLRAAHDRAVREVDERRRAETALQASEARHAQLAGKALMAQEEERSRLSRELHDELGQILTALRLEMGLLAKALGPLPETSRAVVDNAAGLVERSAEELRRICRGLRPPLLDDLGLEPALQTLTHEFAERTGITVHADLDGTLSDERFPPEIALATYRIMQEALNNVSRHASTHEVSVSLFRTPEELQLSVEDRGLGFSPETLSPQQSCGIEGMRERARLVAGILSVTSAPGQGTRVVFRVPITPGGGRRA